jgi:hypothetical protein
MGWIIFLAIAVPLLAVVAWVVFDDSFVRIEPGQLGLLLIHGRATDRASIPVRTGFRRCAGGWCRSTRRSS